MNFDALAIPIAVSVVGALLTFGATLYWHRKTCEARAKQIADAAAAALNAEIADLKSKLAIVTAAIVPISTAFQAVLIKELTHFHTPKMDALMVKLGPPYNLSGAEEVELIAALQERTKDVGDLITESERECALMLPYVIKRVKAEAALGIIDLQVKLVAIPTV